MCQCQEGGLHQVGHVDEGDDLWLVAHGKVDVAAYAVGHHGIVAFTRAIHPRWAQHHVVEALYVGQQGFGLQF